MFNIKVDRELLTYLSEKKMRVDELLVIMCFGLGKLEMLKVFLSGRTGDQCTAFMQALERKGLMAKIAPNVEDFDWDNYKVTEEGNVVYEDCLCSISERDIQEMEAMLISSPEVCIIATTEEEQLGTLVREFLALWPEGTRNVNGDKLKSNAIDVGKKMTSFVKKYKFSKETILRATESYLYRQRAQGYTYCSQAHYFISKENISKLASECEDAERNVGNTSTWENVM